MHILKEKDNIFDKFELSSIQTVFSLGSKRKYEIYLDFGKKENEKILKWNFSKYFSNIMEAKNST